MITNLKNIFLSVIALTLTAQLACSRAVDRPAAPVNTAPQPDDKNELTYENLKAEILANKIGRVQDLLEYIAKTPKYAGLLSSVVLERRSRALHSDEVTPDYPRVVMGSGPMTMHFTANPRLAGHNLIEIIEVTPNDGQLHFHLINMALAGTEYIFLDNPTESNPDQTNLNKMLRLYGQSTNGAVVRCDGCHTSFGSVEKPALMMNWSPIYSSFRVYGYNEGLIKAGTKEARDFESFIKTYNQPLDGQFYRLLHLNFLKNKNGDYVFPENPQRLFNNHVFATARNRMYKTMSGWSLFKRYENVIAGALLNCPNVPDLIPTELKKQHEIGLQNATQAESSDYSLSFDHINHNDVRPQFWIDHAKELEMPNNFGVSENDFLRYTTLPTLQAFAALVRGNLLEVPSDDVVPSDALEEVRLHEDEFLKPAYISRLANLKYIFRAYYREVPRAAYVPVDEVIDFASDSAIFTSFRQSYRIEGAEKGWELFMQENFGPEFLKRHPQLDLFYEHKMSSENLSVPLNDYCSLLNSKDK